MKKALILAALLSLTGCAMIEMIGSQTISSAIKLERTVTLYSASGAPIRTWSGRIYIEDGNGAALTFMLDGKRVTVSGTLVVEEAH